MSIKQWLSPKLYFLSVLIGFCLCIVSGMIVSQHDKLHNFVRFYHGIQPQQQFFPSSFTLLNTALHKASQDKILVLVGGSSILKGVGQNRDELWTLRLQKLLGNQFFVLNYAVDSANLPEFAGVMFRILKERYAKIIYVTTCQPAGFYAIDGQDIIFNYLFWDGYYHHLFQLEKSEKKNILKLRKQELQTTTGLNIHLGSFLDSLFFFRSLWTWVGYHRFFTVWDNFSYNHPLQARKHKQDFKMDLLSIQKEQQTNPIIFQQGVDFVNNIVNLEIDLKKTPFVIRPEIIEKSKNAFNQAFPKSFRKYILCVSTDENPDHLAHVSAKVQLADKYMLEYTRQLLVSLGYHSIIVGEDFSANDFLDARHFTKTGGEKTADAVALQVRQMAKDLHY